METTPRTVRQTLSQLRDLPPVSVERRAATLEKFWQQAPLGPPPETGVFPWAQVRRGIAALAESAPRCLEPERLEKPGVLALILAGNTPLLAWPVLHYAVLLGIPVFIKQSRDEVVWTRHFVETLAQIDPEVAALLHLDLFPGAMDERMMSLIVEANATIAYGSAQTIQALWGYAYWRPFLPFGHATSIGYLGDGSGWQDGDKFAYDVLMYGQQGCLSPHIIYVHGGEHSSILWGKELACALATVAEALNMPPVTDLAIAKRVREVADIARFTAGDTVIQDSALRWTVIYSTQPAILTPGIGHGVVRVIPAHYRFFRHWPHLMGSMRGKISSVGVAGELSEEQRGALQAEGVSRICPAGEMQTPPLDWRNGNVDVRAWLIKALG